MNRPASYVTVRERVTICNGNGGFLTLAPPADPAKPQLAIDAAVDFKTAIGKQRIRFAVDPEKFAYGATARTTIQRTFEPAAVRQIQETSDSDLSIGGAGIAAEAF